MQILEDGITLTVITVIVEIPGGLFPSKIKRDLNVKVLDFCRKEFPLRKLQPIVVGRIDYEVSPLARSPKNTRYAVSVRDGAVVLTVALIHVSGAAGDKEELIKEQLRRKTLDFVDQKFKGKHVHVTVAGRVDYDIA